MSTIAARLCASSRARASSCAERMCALTRASSSRTRNGLEMKSAAPRPSALTVASSGGIDVAAAHHEHRGGDGLDSAGAQRGRGRGARRLHRQMAVLPQKMYRLAQRLVFYQRHPGHVVAVRREVRERDLAHTECDEAVGNAGGALEPHRAPGLE